MKKLMLLLLMIIFCSFCLTVNAQTSSFTYQGRLTDGAVAANGTYQMQFTLFDALGGGTQQGSTITNNSVTVVNGVFTVALGFGVGVFPGGDRWMEIQVRKPPEVTFTTLTPRQQITSSPYSIRSASSGTADSLSASCALCVTDAHISGIDGSKVTGTLPDARLSSNVALLTATQTLTNKTIDSTTNTVTTDKLRSATTVIDVKSAAAPTAGQVLTATNSTTATWVTPAGRTVHFIGESYSGGIVFYVYDNGQHGLIAATADQSTGIQWYNGIYRNNGTGGDGLNAGVMNTGLIVATQMADNQTGNFAAKVCADYSVTVGGIVYGDWYLPSNYELNLLYLQKNVVGGFASDSYWSSSQVSNIAASLQFFGNGLQYSDNKDASYRVRAVRSF